MLARCKNQQCPWAVYAQVEAARPGFGEGEVEGDRSPGPAA